MQCKIIKDLSLVKKFFIADYKLVRNCLSDEEIEDFDRGSLEASDKVSWLGVYKDDELVGITKFSPITNITVDTHAYFRSEHWGNDEITFKGSQAVLEWFKDNTQYCQVLVMAPRQCKQVLKHAHSLGFKLVGALPDVVIWRNKVDSMAVFMYTIDRRI